MDSSNWSNSWIITRWKSGMYINSKFNALVSIVISFNSRDTLEYLLEIYFYPKLEKS